MASLAEIMGQDQAIAMLSRSLDNQLLSHAYLFAGPSGIGKATAAWAFIEELLKREDEEAQVYLQEGMHPDLMEIKVAENRTRISKEQISRDMIPWLAMKPYRARHRIVLIHDSQLMSPEAANALLKTLEEPPDYALIIMLADQFELLETIVSRCQLVRFYPLPDSVVTSLLLKQGVPEKQAVQAARLGQGSIGEALHFSQADDWDLKWDRIIEALNRLGTGEHIAVLETASQLEDDLESSSRLLETILRDRLICQYSDDDNMLIFPEGRAGYEKMPRLDPEQMRASLNRIQQVKRSSRFHVNKSLISINIAYELQHLLHKDHSRAGKARTQRR